MRRILIFSLAYLPYIGGAEIAIREITDRMDPSEYEFHLVTLRMNPKLARKEQIGTVLVHRIGYGNSHLMKFCYQFLAAWHGSRLNRTHEFAAVWAMMAHSSGVPAALYRLYHPDTPYILTLQEGDPPETIEATMHPLWPLFSRAFTSATRVQAISQFLGAWARRRGYRGPLEIIPNGVNGDAFSKEISIEEKAAVRQRFALGVGDKVLITISRLVHKNGVDLVLRALPNMSREVKFLVVGDGPERTALEKLAHDLGVENRVVFAGSIENALLPPMLHASDMFIRASRSEGQGIVFIEAMAAAVPVIAPQIGGITDFLFDEERNNDRAATGFTIDPESPESIVRAVEKIIDDPLHAHQIAVHAQRTVLRDYDWDKIAAEMRGRVFDAVLT